MRVRKLVGIWPGLFMLLMTTNSLALLDKGVQGQSGAPTAAATLGTPPSSAPGTVQRAHPKLLAPHRPIPPRVPDAKRHPLPAAKAGSVIGGIWMTGANLKSSLYLRSIIATTAITVKPIIYLSNGTRLPLDDVKLDADGVAVVDINAALEKQGISSSATLSGYVEVQYNFPWNPICAMVRALDLVHSLLFYYSLQPSLHVPRTKFKPGQAPIQLPPETAAAHTVEGLWWKQEANVTGFVGLANTTAQPLIATVNVSDQEANPIAQHTVTISPHGMKLVDLTELATTSSGSGGITVAYTGLRDDLLVDGALQDPIVGYSAMLPFMFLGTQLPDAAQTSLAELGLMVGAADPMMSFPAGTTFTPYSVLRNITDAPVTANPTLWWMASGTPQYADIPVMTLAPHQSQLLDLPSVLASAGLKNFTGSVNLVFDVQAKAGSLLLSAGSVDQTNNYVFAVYPRGIGESASKSLSYWTTANGDDTMVTLWNPADEAQSLVFRLNYPGGHYLLPIQLGPKATQVFNVTDVIRSGTADAEGNIIPPSVREGSAVLMGSQAKMQKILVAVDASTYNVKKATCGGQCWTCDGYGDAFIDIYDFGVGANGAQTQESFYGMYDDTSEVDDTSGAGWSSDNTGVMTVNTGMVTGQAPGTANISAYDPFMPVYDPNFCCQTCSYCDEQGQGAGSPGIVASLSCSPSSVTRGSSVTCTATGPSGSTFSNWKFTGGTNTVNGSGTSSTWSGVMVTSGTVSVKVNSNGTSSIPTAQITVNGRSGFTLSAVAATSEPNGFVGDGCSISVSSPPAQSGDAVGKFCLAQNVSFQTSSIGDNGPNNGFSYVTSISGSNGAATTGYFYVISPDLQNTSSTFYQAQCGNYNATSNPNGFISGSNLLTNTIRHESGTVQSHYENYVVAQNSPSNNLGTVAEGMTGLETAQTLANNVTSTLNQNIQTILSASQVEPCSVQQDASCNFQGYVNFSPYQACN